MGKTEKPDVTAETNTIGRIDFNNHKHEFTAMIGRGDFVAPDYTHATLTGDFGTYDLDLSSIVGVRSCLVLLRLSFMDLVTGSFISLFTKGFINLINTTVAITQVAGAFIGFDSWVRTDANGKISYRGVWTGDVFLWVTVAEWEKE